MENGAFAPRSKCSIFHNIFKYIVFQRRQKVLSWSKGLHVKKRDPFLMNEMDLNFDKIIHFFLVNRKFYNSGNAIRLS